MFKSELNYNYIENLIKSTKLFDQQSAYSIIKSTLHSHRNFHQHLVHLYRYHHQQSHYDELHLNEIYNYNNNINSSYVNNNFLNYYHYHYQHHHDHYLRYQYQDETNTDSIMPTHQFDQLSIQFNQNQQLNQEESEHDEHKLSNENDIEVSNAQQQQSIQASLKSTIESQQQTQQQQQSDHNDNISENQYRKQIKFTDIPWRDIIYPHIFARLTWKDLFRIQRVSRELNIMVKEYFRTLIKINLSEISTKFSSIAFTKLVEKNFNLRYINLSNCKWISDEHIDLLISNCNQSLYYLNLSNCFDITNQCIQRVSLKCKNLKSLLLKNCHWISGETIVYISEHNSFTLEEIDLTSCWEINDDAAIYLIQKCTRLKRLSLTNIYGITDNVLSALTLHTFSLEYLNVSGCWRITDTGMRLLAEYCSNLRHLVVGDCRDISEESLYYLRNIGVQVDVPLDYGSRIHQLLRGLDVF